MRLLLINPPQRWTLAGFPGGLLDLRHFVRLHRPDVQVVLLDLQAVAEGEVEGRLRGALASGSGPALAGISVTTATYQAGLHVARIIKALDDEVTVILGGPHATADDETILRAHAEIDCVVRGEGERTLLGLVNHHADFSAVPGVSFRQGVHLVRNPAPDPLSTADLDSMALPQLGVEDIRPPGRCGRITYVSARGCPLACSFCAVARDAARHKSTARVVSDLEWLVCERGFTEIAIEDNFFAQSQRRTLELCDALARAKVNRPGMQFAWDCQTRVESLVSPDISVALARAGCTAVFVGVENFGHAALRWLNKTADSTRYVLAVLERVVPQVLDAGLECLFNFQLGLPEERESDRLENLEVLKRVGAVAKRRGRKVTICPMLHVLYPGTTLFQGGIARGDYQRDLFEDFTRWEAEETSLRQWLGRNFAHGTGGVPTGILAPELLRTSRFEPEWRRLVETDNYLDRIMDIDGIEVFRYGTYLA
jgi:anaerobic magnesium-protoporphyrin IX monomethyl ester cyclase